jgi:ribosomal protein S18 acetylase RimI-like enzyme
MLSDDGAPVGLSLTLSGTEVERCRRADMVALLADKSMDRSKLLSRLRPLRELFAPVPSDSFYLSKISVRRENRGGGIGAALLDDVIARAAQREICLDVSMSNTSAIGLYESRGFKVSSTTAAVGMEYARLVLNAG